MPGITNTGAKMVASLIPKIWLHSWHPLELFILLEQLGHGLGGLRESFDEPTIVSY
jgi:hypothetical protein